MKQSDALRSKELFPGSNIIRKYTFKTMNTRDNYALLAKANHQLAQAFDTTRDKSAYFYKPDCFECLSPNIKAA